ncbi:MAG TPA: maltose ABC transporter substrate-binding protein [Tetrasphaera sp.]|uniref:sugar ABC transporter substrate-binding protein n=1 Tax=Nostocoides sp. TaxID=1917966 RepID=UPI002BD295BD|nr:maltose ABC transporter substrate-binding protein [Tetrasphaera sp.]HNQ06782.1 maltose ABC transporter substrate-binding protein [Tetrasphaera sp.]
MHKRAFGAAALTSVAALTLAACGNGGNSSTSATAGSSANMSASASTSASASASETAAAPAEVDAKNPSRADADLVIWADADRAPILTKYAQQFAADNGVTVAVQIATETRKQFGDATKVGKGPDIVVGAHDWLGELVQNGTVAPIQLDDATTAKFAPAAMAASKFNGQNYGVPFSVENIALVRNTDMVPDAPATLDDLLKAAKAAQTKDKKITTLLDQSVGKTGNAYYTYPWLSAFGGGIFAVKDNGDYDASKVIVNSAESIKGATVLAQMGKDKVLSTNVGDDNAEGIFTSGKAPFFITGPWSIPNVKKAGINYGISSLPSLPGGKAMQPFLGVQLFYVSAKAKNASLAQDFVTTYVPTKEFQLAIFAAGGRPPALTEAYDEVAASDPEVEAWYEAGKDGKPMPNIPAMNSVWGPLGQAAADVISGKAEPKARFDAAQKEIVKAIAGS